jgi:hypothetical protein
MYHPYTFLLSMICVHVLFYIRYSITFTWIYFLFMLFVYIGVQHILYKCCNFFFLVLCTLHVSAVSLDCPFSIALSVFSDVYLYQLWWGPTILVISKWCIFSVDFYDIHWLCNMLIHTIFLYFSWWQNYFQSKFVILYSVSNNWNYDSTAIYIFGFL